MPIKIRWEEWGPQRRVQQLLDSMVEVTSKKDLGSDSRSCPKRGSRNRYNCPNPDHWVDEKMCPKCNSQTPSRYFQSKLKTQCQFVAFNMGHGFHKDSFKYQASNLSSSPQIWWIWCGLFTLAKFWVVEQNGHRGSSNSVQSYASGCSLRRCFSNRGPTYWVSHFVLTTTNTRDY